MDTEKQASRCEPTLAPERGTPSVSSKTEATICYLLAKRAPRKLSKSALLKLCYFADLENVRRHGKPITDGQWRRDDYGAVAYEIPNAARLIAEVEVHDYTTYTGMHGTDFWLAEVKDCGLGLTMNERVVLNDVWEQFGTRSAKDLGAETKKTEPWVAAVRAGVQELDLSVAAPAPGNQFAYFAHVLEGVDLSVRGTPEEITALKDETDRFMTPFRLEACG